MMITMLSTVDSTFLTSCLVTGALSICKCYYQHYETWNKRKVLGKRFKTARQQRREKAKRDVTVYM